MIRYTRRGTIRNAVHVPRAIAWATELNGFVNKRFQIDLKVGLEMGGSLNMMWFFDVPDLATLETVNQKLLSDKAYWQMVDQVKDIWVNGTLKDTIINVFAE